MSGMAQTPTVSGPPPGRTAVGVTGTATADAAADPQTPGSVSESGRPSEPEQVSQPGNGPEPGDGPEAEGVSGPGEAADTRTPATPGATAEPAGGPTGESAPPRRRGIRGTGLDMVRSLGLLLAVVAVVWFVSGMGHSDTRGQATVADWQSSAAGLPAAVGFDLQAPPAVPPGWAVTVLRVAGTATWTMTVTTAHSHYIDLLQTAGDPATVQAAVLPDATPAGRARLGTTGWSVFVLPSDDRGNPRRALIRAVPGTATRPTGAGSASGSASGSGAGPAPATVVVLSGTATAAEMDTFAAALRTLT